MPLTYVSILTTHGQIGYKLYDPNIYGDVMVKNAGERLESIKAAHKSSHGASSVRMEDYLEVIAELVDLKGYATTLDISRYMDVSAPSVILDQSARMQEICVAVLSFFEVVQRCYTV